MTSLLTNKPLLFRNDEIKVLLPPGAAQRSNIMGFSGKSIFFKT